MSYLAKTMTPGETVLIEIRPSSRPFVASCVAFTIITLGIGSLFALPVYLLKLFTNQYNEIAVTNRRLVVKRGLISYATDEYLLRQVESVQVRQSLFGRMFGWGIVLVHGSGGDPMSCVVTDAYELRQALDQAIDMAQRRT